MTRRSAWLGALVTALVAAHALAGDDFTRTDARDELALARAASAAGDAALAAHLQGDRYEALLAIRAIEHARAPEQLIPALAQLACGRDPTLAPEAAATLQKLAVRLTPSELAAREALNSELDRARASLRCAGPRPLPEIAHALLQLAAALN
jgi:hypothetical protein